MKTPWWYIWNPDSGFIGGLILGAVISLIVWFIW